MARRRDHRGIHLGLDQRQPKGLRFLHGVDNVNWVAVSPSNTFAPGESTGFVLGRDEMLVAPDGSSHLTTRNDGSRDPQHEIEDPGHVCERFTVRDE